MNIKVISVCACIVGGVVGYIIGDRIFGKQVREEEKKLDEQIKNMSKQLVEDAFPKEEYSFSYGNEAALTVNLKAMKMTPEEKKEFMRIMREKGYTIIEPEA